MLETIREYAREQLERHGDGDDVRRHHAAHYLDVAEGVAAAFRRPAHGCGLDVLEAEHGNLRAALQWSLDHEAGETALRLCAALWWFWYIHGHLTEGRRWLDAVLASGGEPTDVRRANVLAGAGYLAIAQGDYVVAEARLTESLAVFRQDEDRSGVGLVLAGLGSAARYQGNLDRAQTLCAEAVEVLTAADDRWHLATAVTQLGLVAHATGDHGQAQALHERGLALREELGDEFGMIVSVALIGRGSLDLGDRRRAGKLYQRCLALSRAAGYRAGEAQALTDLGHLALLQGDAAESGVHWREALALWHDLGDREAVAASLEGLAWVASDVGDAVRAARLFGAAESQRQAIGAPMPSADDPSHRHYRDALRALAGEHLVEVEWANGRMLSTEEAIAEAMALDPGTAAETPRAESGVRSPDHISLRVKSRSCDWSRRVAPTARSPRPSSLVITRRRPTSSGCCGNSTSTHGRARPSTPCATT